MRPQKAKPHRQQQRNKRVYAIAFDLNTATAEAVVGTSWRNCYAQIATVLSEYGFTRQQGSVYFGDESSDAVRCVMAVQDLDRRYAWFNRVVSDLRMLRVDEDNDLLPALSNQLRLGDRGAA
ncbi:virulence factor [Hansschlegelia sp. KR7-227]|uniref:virulence factor n=1 Tax=Hansschlegelia sp. KR7-227 TaxID=3400914 RepID=UPI003C0437A8